MKSESQKQEARLADKYGGQVSAASGAMWHRKSDVRTGSFMIEAKFTSKNSISLKKDWLVKVEREAILESRVPLLALAFSGKNYIILTEDDFDSLLEAVLDVARAREMPESC